MRNGNNSIVYIVSSFSAIGGFLIGYYCGVISGVLTMENFRNQMDLNDSISNSYEQKILEHKTGAITGILLTGCFVGALIGGQTSDRFSRKYSISAFSFLLTISSAVQTASLSFPLTLVARFFAGLSLGALSMIIPVYQSEIAATQIRGQLIAIQHCALTFGITVSTWINVGMFFATPATCSCQWQIPFGLQTIPSLILAIGILFCPFSPRWLISRDRVEEAREVLMKIRSTCDDETEEELNRITIEVAYLRENEVDSYSQLFRSPLLRCFLLGVGIQIFQQLTGISGTICYAPQVFAKIFSNETGLFPGIDPSLPLILTAVYGSVYFLAAITAIFFIDKISRRVLLMTGGVVMFLSLVLIGIFMVIFGESSPSHYMNITVYDFNSALLRATLIILMHIYVVGFAFSWGPIPWAYCAEIFPLTMRAKATSLTTAANWLTSSLVTYVVPLLLVYVPYGTFLIFSSLCGLMVVIVFFFYPDIRDTHLEDIPKQLEQQRQNNYNTFPTHEVVNQTNVDD